MGDLRSALEVQLEALSLGDEFAAPVELCRALADALDDRVGDDKLVREYRLALGLLRVDESSGDESFADAWRRFESEVSGAVKDR